MKKKRRYHSFFKVIALCGFVFALGYSYYYMKNEIPTHLRVVVKKEGKVNLKLPFSGRVYSDSKEVMLSTNESKFSQQVSIASNETFSIYSSEIGKYKIGLELFGFLRCKDITVDVVLPEWVIPCGLPVGIYLESNGVLVIGTSKLHDINGNVQFPSEQIVKSGDYILKVNNETITTKEDLIQKVNNCKSQDIVLTIRRNEEIIDVKITPVQISADEYKLGLWVRDDTQGIGTVTYVDMNGGFGALGHGISDSDTKCLVESNAGSLYMTEIKSIIKGTSGTPGSLSGVICYGDNHYYGQIYGNTSKGIYGKVNDNFTSKISLEPVPLGYKQEIECGKAQILCTVDGELRYYDIEIVEVNTSNQNDNKGIVLKITDKELLEKTGGIVQGMSGSPIIQNGKLIGAVTHVFIEDSTKGYGIFIEEMIEMQEKLTP